MHKNTDIYTIDFTNIESYSDVHLTICNAFDWPGYYGCNWDAFWDCITSMLGDPLHIRIVGLNVFKQKFTKDAEKMISVLKEFKHYDDECSDSILIEIVDDDKRTVIE